MNLGRTTKTNITFYRTDGMGRDGYITYNNAGFWKDKHIKTKISYPRKKFAVFHSLIHQPAPFKYYSDGSGRDSYVLENNGGLVKPFDPLAKQHLSKFLRNGEERHIFKHKLFLTKRQIKYMNKLKKIQDGVISRLYNDSLERIKQNNLQCRGNSINDFFTKQKYRPMSGIITPKNNCLSLNYTQSLQNMSGDSIKENKRKLINLKANTPRGKNIIEKYLRNKNNHESNDTNENKKIKLMKNLKLNPSGLKCDILNDDDNNKTNQNNNIKECDSFNSLTPNYTKNKWIDFGYGNKIKKNNKNFFNNNTFGSFSTTQRNKLIKSKLINNVRKRNDIKKYILSNRNIIFSEPNKTNNYN